MTFKKAAINILKDSFDHSHEEMLTCAAIKKRVKSRYGLILRDGTISSLVYKLYRKGYIARHENVGDRNGMGYELTSDGRQIL